jgi:hypothetical protein
MIEQIMRRRRNRRGQFRRRIDLPAAAEFWVWFMGGILTRVPRTIPLRSRK